MPTQKEVDTLPISPLNKESLAVFKTLLRENGLEFGWTRYYALSGYYMWISKEPDAAISYAKKAIKNYGEIEEKYPSEEIHLANAYFTLGKIFKEKKEYKKSIIHFLNCLEVEKKYPLKTRGFIIEGIAANHLALGNDSIALKFYKQALADSTYTSYPRSLVTALTRVGVIYSSDQQNKMDSAKYYYHKAIKSSLDLNYKNNLSTIYSNLGDIYKDEGNRDSTINYYIKAHEILKRHAPKGEEARIKTSLYDKTNYSLVKIYSGNINQALDDLHTVLDTLKKSAPYDKNDKGIFLSVYENMAIAYQHKKNYPKANKILLEKEEFLKLFHKTELNQELEKLQVAYETREKESEILRLGLLNENQFILQKRQQVLFISLAALLLVILGSVWFYFYQRNLTNKYRRVVLQQQLLRTQMDPHFTYNALNAIVVLNKERPTEVENYVLSLSKLVRLILENSRKEFVPLEKEIEALENYLVLQSNFSKKFTYEIHVSHEIQPEYCEILPMMLQPFVENAIIHGIASKKQNGHIAVNFKANGNSTIQCDINDNGIGYGKTIKTDNLISEKHTSLSLKIAKERMAIYNKKFRSDASITIQELKNEKNEAVGTNVKILLHYNYL